MLLARYLLDIPYISSIKQLNLLQIMNIFRKLLIPALASAGLAVSSYAGAVLQIWDGAGNNVTILDNAAGDTNAASGVIGWNGSFNGWSIDLASGLTLNSGSNADIDLSGQVRSVGAHSGDNMLRIYYGDNNFGPSSGSSLAGVITGNTGANTSLIFGGLTNTFSNDAVGGTTNHGVFANQASFTPSPYPSSFAVTIGGSFPDATLYSLAEVVKITNAGDGSFTSFDARVNVPVPDSASTVLMVGLGLLGIGLAVRRSKVTQA